MEGLPICTYNLAIACTQPGYNALLLAMHVLVLSLGMPITFILEGVPV